MFAYFNNTMIGNCHTVRILTEIFNNMFRFTKRRLAVNNPSFVPGLFNMVGVFRQKTLTGKMLFYSRHKLSPELKAKTGNRVNVFAGLANLPHPALNRIAKGRNNTMNMRMKAEILAPGM